jgi:hypothetical protein
MPGSSSFFSTPLSEADIRHLANPAAFLRGKAIATAGDVRTPAASSNALSALVGGTWHRSYATIVSYQGPRLVAECPCGRPGMCQHAVALLLFWLQSPAAFSRVDSLEQRAAMLAIYTSATANSAPEEVAQQRARDRRGELISLLANATLSQLREMVKNHGMPPGRAKTKDEAVDLVADTLLAEGAIARIYAQLSGDERLALDAALLLGNSNQVVPAGISRLFQALRGQPGPAPVESLFRRGLILPAVYTGSAVSTYRVPTVVGTSLPRRETLPFETEPLRGKPETFGAAGPADRSVEELSQILVYHLQRGPLAQNSVAGPLEAGASATVRPSGLHLVAGPGLPDVGGDDEDVDLDFDKDFGEDFDDEEDDDSDGERLTVAFARALLNRLSGGQGAPASDGALDLQPAAGSLPLAYLRRLAELTGEPEAAIGFAGDLLAALGILNPAEPPSVRDDRLTGYFALPTEERRRIFVDAWLRFTTWSELSLAAGPNGPLVLRQRAGYWQSHAPFPADLLRFRWFVYGLIERLTPGVWHSVDAIVAVLHRLRAIPEIGISDRSLPKTLYAWVAERARTDVPLDPTKPDQFDRLFRPVVEAILRGPLTWLGVVDLRFQGGRPNAFAIRATGDHAIAPIEIQSDLSVQIPIGGANPQAYELLGKIAEFEQATPDGLRYRITPENLAWAFDQGVNGTDLLQQLHALSGGKLPDAVRARLSRWWEGYGTLRLYDEVTILEFGDEYLLAEALATTALRASIVATLSPRTVVVDAAAAADLRAEFARRGYTPRIVEEA